MVPEKSNMKKFKSISTGELCTAAQYVAETICVRKREKDNTGSLEYKFWNKSHKHEYEIQVRVACKLIKKFGEDALLHYINSPSGKRVFSLGFLHKSQKFVLILNFVQKGVSKSACILKKNAEREKHVLDVPEKEIEYKPKKSMIQNTLFSKIKDIEDNMNGKN